MLSSSEWCACAPSSLKTLLLGPLSPYPVSRLLLCVCVDTPVLVCDDMIDMIQEDEQQQQGRCGASLFSVGQTPRTSSLVNTFLLLRTFAVRRRRPRPLSPCVSVWCLLCVCQCFGVRARPSSRRYSSTECHDVSMAPPGQYTHNPMDVLFVPTFEKNTNGRVKAGIYVENIYTRLLHRYVPVVARDQVYAACRDCSFGFKCHMYQYCCCDENLRGLTAVRIAFWPDRCVGPSLVGRMRRGTYAWSTRQCSRDVHVMK